VRRILSVAVTIVFVLVFALPVFAQNMTHNATYEMDGSIDLEKQVGHLCNTGAEMKQTIKGEGEITKVMDTAQVAGKLTVSDDQDWVTAEGALRNLTVTSVIGLCAPAKHEYTTTHYVPVPPEGQPPYVREIGNMPDEPNYQAQIFWSEEFDPNPGNPQGDWTSSFLLEGATPSQSSYAGQRLGWVPPPTRGDRLTILAGAVISIETGLPNEQEEWEFIETGNGAGLGAWFRIASNVESTWHSYEVESGILPPQLGYPADWDKFYHSNLNPGPGDTYKSLNALLDAYGYNDLNDALAGGFDYYVTEVEALTDQIWAVQVSADPGFSGALTQDFEAAYGPWAQHHGYLGDDDDAWWFVDDEGDMIDFDNNVDIADIDDIDVGDDYVGNYFNIDQMARTSQGTTKRYISISSPWSHAFVMEDMTIVGMAEISESFVMDNISPGAEAVPDWWELF